MLKTEDVKKLLVEKYKHGDFRITKTGIKTVELQGIQFEADKDSIIRKPNYDYAKREIEWYESQSLNVNDIPGGTPTIWKQCADVNGEINSNYGWMIYSKENGSQYNNCIWQLVNDPATREACMIYNRPSMQEDYKKNGMHDFCCTYAVQCFLNEVNKYSTLPDGSKVKLGLDGYMLDYHVFMRSNDAVFGFCNDACWHMYVFDKMINDLSEKLGCPIYKGKLIWNTGSLHVYERHFKFLEE